MLRCVEFVEQVTTVDEGVAPPRLRLSFHLHRLLCSNCRRYLRQIRAVRDALHCLAEPERPGESPPPPDLEQPESPRR